MYWIYRFFLYPEVSESRNIAQKSHFSKSHVCHFLEHIFGNQRYGVTNLTLCNILFTNLWIIYTPICLQTTISVLLLLDTSMSHKIADFHFRYTNEATSIKLLSSTFSIVCIFLVTPINLSLVFGLCIQWSSIQNTFSMYNSQWSNNRWSQSAHRNTIYNLQTPNLDPEQDLLGK